MSDHRISSPTHHVIIAHLYEMGLQINPKCGKFLMQVLPLLSLTPTISFR